MTSSIKILLADDDADDAALFCEAVREINSSIRCITVESGLEAMQILENDLTNLPSIIFLDINMPLMNGWECLSRIKGNDQLNHIPVIIYSTSSTQKDVNLAAQFGALCFFIKPESYKDLKEILRVVTENIDDNLLNAMSKFDNIKHS